MNRMYLMFVLGLLCAVSLTCSLSAPREEPAGVSATGISPEIVQAIPTSTQEYQTGSPVVVLPTHIPIPSSTTDRIQPESLAYVGAFRLPGDGDRPLTFAYGGSAMTFNPDGDPDGAEDGFPGSLFITGHDRLPYGELPNGSQIAEVSIPVPLEASAAPGLNQAEFIQPFSNVTSGHFTGLDELPRTAMQYLDVPATGPKIHIAWGQHLDPDPQVPSHAWFSPDLMNPKFQGEWFIGERPSFSVNGYMLAIPEEWAVAYTQGRLLGTGRFRDGGWSGMGPALFAYQPWLDAQGTPAVSHTRLPETTLLQYASSEESSVTHNSMKYYQHPDEWEGAAWLTTPSGSSAVLFAGTKSDGLKYWYGYTNPAGPDYPCVDGEFVGLFPVCLMADGSECPPADLVECRNHNDFRGWWTTHFSAQFLFYDPADFAAVAGGALQPWEPQPYAALDIDPYLYHNPDQVELDMLGTGVQRRYRIGEVAYDRASGILYVLELFADEARPVVHVWRIQP